MKEAHYLKCAIGEINMDSSIQDLINLIAEVNYIDDTFIFYSFAKLLFALTLIAVDIKAYNKNKIGLSLATCALAVVFLCWNAFSVLAVMGTYEELVSSVEIIVYDEIIHEANKHNCSFDSETEECINIVDKLEVLHDVISEDINKTQGLSNLAKGRLRVLLAEGSESLKMSTH